MPEGIPPLSTTAPLLDFQGERDERTWYMREKVLEDALIAMRDERDFLREVIRTLASNQESKP